MSTLNDSLLGQQVDEYRIDKSLGQGGMARVYRALDVKLERYVALKVIAPAFRTDEDYTARFTREAQSIARLNHPNIVHIYRFGQADGMYYMAMEYVEGTDVRWLIEDYRSSGELIPIADVVRIIQDIGGALDYAHSKNVIHRDIKPSNIMMDSRGRAILTDFGLALLSDQGTRGQIFGSPHYISPEQAVSSGNVVPQSDLYALGVTLFEMLTGDLPFADGEPMDIAMKHVSEPPPPPSRFNSTISPAIDEVVLRSLAKEPYERYLTGAEMSSALQEAVANWPGEQGASDMKSRRPSLVRAPQKVSDLIRMAPIPVPPPNLPEGSFASRGSTADTLPPVPSGPTQPASTLVSDKTGSSWLYPLALAGAVLIIGLLGLIVLLLLTRNSGAPAVAALPTAAPTVTIAPTDLPPAQVPTLSASLEPTVTPLVLTTMPTSPTVPQPTPVPPTVPAATVPPTPAPVVPTAGIPSPPSDRTVIPPGSVRLGEFAVESYCNSRGYGIKLVNGDQDWACTDRSTGATVSVLGPSDFDSICRSRYANPAAFAIRDQQKPTLAYDWSCYAYVTPPPTLVPTAVPVLAATPSIFALMLSYTDTWVALTNVSTIPLSLAQVQFTRDNRTLTATLWGKAVLNPGDCLRVYTGDTPPTDLPKKCTTVFDLIADKTERAYWLTGPVYVSISPSVTYCYPAKQCPS